MKTGNTHLYQSAFSKIFDHLIDLFSSFIQSIFNTCRMDTTIGNKLFESFFTPENLVITLVGDIDPDFAVELLERDLTLPAKAKSLPAPPRPPEMVTGKKVFRAEAAQEQAHMLAGFLGARVNDEDTR